MKHVIDQLESIGRAVPDAPGFEEAVLRRLPAGPLPAAAAHGWVRRVSAVAALVVVAASVVTGILLTAGAPRQAFGQVLLRAERFDTVRYHLRKDDGAVERRTRAPGGRSHTELTPAGGGPGLVAIRNPQTLPDATLFLYPDRAVAEFEPADLGRDATVPDDPVEELRAIANQGNVTSAPDESRAGSVRAFTILDATGQAACRVFVNKTGLPVCIEYGGDVRRTLDGFEWGIALDERQFATNPPAGYTVVYDAMRPLSHGLSAYAKCFDGRLPDSLDAASLDAWRLAADRLGRAALRGEELDLQWGFAAPAFAKRRGLDLRYYGRGKRFHRGRAGGDEIVVAIERAPGGGIYDVLMSDQSRARLARSELP